MMWSTLTEIKNRFLGITNWVIHRSQEEDKQLHFKWSFWLTIWGLLLWPPSLAMSLVLIIGLLKELWDERYGSGFCSADFLFNLGGIAFAMAFYLSAPEGIFEI